MTNPPHEEATLPPDSPKSSRSFQTDLLAPLPMTRIIVLTLIVKFPNTTGYELMQLVPKTLHPNLTFKTGTLYSELRRLEKLGKLTSIQSPTGRKQRRYTISASGKHELIQLSLQIQDRLEFIINPLVEIIDSLDLQAHDAE